jgi:hypothetical protein
MIGDAGHGAAMATAPAEVRIAGRYIAAPVEQDGAAALIEALVLAPAGEAARNAAALAAEAAALQAGLRAVLAIGEPPAWAGSHALPRPAAVPAR